MSQVLCRSQLHQNTNEEPFALLDLEYRDSMDSHVTRLHSVLTPCGWLISIVHLLAQGHVIFQSSISIFQKCCEEYD